MCIQGTFNNAVRLNNGQSKRNICVSCIRWKGQRVQFAVHMVIPLQYYCSVCMWRWQCKLEPHLHKQHTQTFFFFFYFDKDTGFCLKTPTISFHYLLTNQNLTICEIFWGDIHYKLTFEPDEVSRTRFMFIPKSYHLECRIWHGCCCYDHKHHLTFFPGLILNFL